MNKYEQIRANSAYQQILADSFGGVMYNVANRGKYDTAELLRLWNSLTPGEQHAAGGIMNGAINFITEVTA